MDGLLLRATDWIGDRLQEDLGIPLPAILRFVKTGTIVFVLLVVGLHFQESVLSGAIWMAFWSMTVYMNVNRSREYTADLEHWDKESTRLRYLTYALAMRYSTFLCVIRVTMVVIQVPVSVLLLMYPTDLRSLSSVAGALLGLIITTDFYAQCILPKPPKHRSKAVEMKLASVGSGI